jgi:hypothetical protein
MKTATLTTYRRITKVFLILFIFLMPVLIILRFDADTHEFILFGISWSFGIRPEYYVDQCALGALRIALHFF